MKKSKSIGIYIFVNYWGGFGFALLALVGMFWLAMSVPLIEQVVLRKESLGTFLELSVLLLPRITQTILPMSALAAAIYQFNRLASDAELVVMSAGGLNPLRLLRPMFFAGLILSGILFLTTIWLAPAARADLKLKLWQIERNFNTNIILGGNFVKPVKNITIFADESLQSGEMINVFIDDRRDPERIINYFAARALFTTGETENNVALIDGRSVERNLDNSEIRVSEFDRAEVKLTIDPEENEPPALSNEEKPFRQIATERIQNEDPTALNSEYANRILYPLLGFLMPLLPVLLYIYFPFSRHSYDRVIFVASFFGITFNAIYIGAYAATKTNNMMFLLYFLPILFLIWLYFICWRRLRSI